MRARIAISLIMAALVVVNPAAAEKKPPQSDSIFLKTNPSIVTMTLTPTFYRFTGWEGHDLLAEMGKDRATICDTKVQPEEVWEQWQRLYAASAMQMGESFCNWWKANRKEQP